MRLMNAGYPYAQGDPLEQRNDYTYAPFQGPAFMDAWLQARQEILDELPAPRSAPAAIDLKPAARAGGYDTAQLLEALVIASEQESTEKVPANLLRLLQRFEVSGRIHTRYSQVWRATDPQDFRELGLYLRFAEVLDRYYGRSDRLDLLNALIKCLDTLCPLRSRLDAGLQTRLAALLVSERRHIDRLTQKIANAAV
jgi:methionyl-tRNA formyltransferase